MQKSVKFVLAAFSAPPKSEGKSLSGAKMASAINDAIVTAVKITFLKYFYEFIFANMRGVTIYKQA